MRYGGWTDRQSILVILYQMAVARHSSGTHYQIVCLGSHHASFIHTWGEIIDTVDGQKTPKYPCYQMERLDRQRCGAY